MGIKLKFTLNVCAILLIFAAFRPSKHVGMDYGASVISLAVVATIAEDFWVDQRRAKQTGAPEDLWKVRFGKWGISLSLLATVALAIIVPKINRYYERESVQQQIDESRWRDTAARSSDANVQNGIQMMNDLKARRAAQSSSTAPTIEPATQVTHAPASIAELEQTLGHFVIVEGEARGSKSIDIFVLRSGERLLLDRSLPDTTRNKMVRIKCVPRRALISAPEHDDDEAVQRVRPKTPPDHDVYGIMLQDVELIGFVNSQ